MRALMLLLVTIAPLVSAEDASFLLRGATVHTVSGDDIPNGAVLVLKGKIEEVGPKVTAPKGIRIIEAKGLHVYPGMMDSGTEIGLSEISSVTETNDTRELGDFNPQLRALIAVNPGSEHIPVTRANGITSVITLPQGGILAGQAALIHLDGWTWQEMAVAGSVAMHLRFPIPQAPSSRSSSRQTTPVPFRELLRTHDRQVRELEQLFESARRYQKAKTASGAGFEPDLKMEALLPVIERKQPLLVTAVRERAIREALRFAEKENVRIILAQARDAWKVADELKAKNIPVILGPTLELPLDEDDPYDKAFTLPAELYKAGVKFAFATFSVRESRNLPYQAATGVAFGLPYREALKAVTLNPAEIWGVADQIGSLDKGKWADLMVTDGDPLETRTQVKQLFIKGKAADLENKQRRLYEKYMARP
jgi:imidazolonepropionase-like amidohydrolase